MGRYAGWLKVIIWLAQEPFKIRNLSANVGRWSVSTQSLSSNPAKNNNIIWPHLPLNLFSSFQPIWSYSEPELALVFLHMWTWRPERIEGPCFLQDVILHLFKPQMFCWFVDLSARLCDWFSCPNAPRACFWDVLSWSQ